MVCDELQEEGDHEPHVRGTAVFVGDELSVVNKTSDLLHQLWGGIKFYDWETFELLRFVL